MIGGNSLAPGRVAGRHRAGLASQQRQGRAPARAIAEVLVGGAPLARRLAPRAAPARARASLRRAVVSITVTGRSGDAARTSSAASRAIGRRSTGRDHDVAALVEAREGEEVLDEEAHADGLLLDAVHRLGMSSSPLIAPIR